MAPPLSSFSFFSQILWGLPCPRAQGTQRCPHLQHSPKPFRQLRVSHSPLNLILRLFSFPSLHCPWIIPWSRFSSFSGPCETPRQGLGFGETSLLSKLSRWGHRETVKWIFNRVSQHLPAQPLSTSTKNTFMKKWHCLCDTARQKREIPADTTSTSHWETWGKGSN